MAKSRAERASMPVCKNSTALRSNRFAEYLILIVVSVFALSSCRTSQQESRRNSARAGNAGTSAVSRQVDSLLMIQEKLTEVIDSMTNLVESDHSRIRTLEQQVQELQQSRSYGSRPPMPPPSDPPSYNSAPSYVPPRAQSLTAPATPQERYSSALRMYNENHFSEALEEFRALEREDASSSYAPNYKYWEGESEYALKRYNQAMKAFGEVISQYPNSSKAAPAQFKIGECYERLGIPQAARDAYERVIADYPTSEFRARAQTRLKALRY